MASTVQHNGQSITINDPDAYNKLSFRDKISYLDQQIKPATQTSTPVAPVQGQQMYQTNLPVQQPQQPQVQQPAPQPAPQPAQPSNAIKPNQIPQPQQPAPQKTQPAVDNKAITDVVSSVYQQYGLTPQQDKLAIHQQNISKGVESGFYKDPESARQDVNSAVLSGIKTDPNSIFTMMKNSVDIPQDVKSGSAFTQAQNRFTKLKQWTSMNPTTFLNSVGEIVPGSQLEQDLMEIPGMKSQMENARKIASLNDIALGKQSINQQHQNEMNLSKQILEDLDTSLIDDYKNAMQAEDIVAKRKAADDEYAKLKEIDAHIANIEMEAYDEFKGTGATETQIRNVIATRTKNLTAQRNVQQARYDSEFSRFTNATNLVKDEMTYRAGDQQFQSSIYSKLQSTPLANTATALRDNYFTKAQETQNTIMNAPAIVGKIAQSVVGGLDNPTKWTNRATDLATQGYTSEQIENQLMLEMGTARKEGIKAGVSSQPLMTYEQADKIQNMAYKQAQAQNLQADNERLGKEIVYREITDKYGNKSVIGLPKYTDSPVRQFNSSELSGMGYTDKQVGRMEDALSVADGEYFGECGAYLNNKEGTPGMYQDSLASKSRWATKKSGVVGDHVVFDTGTSAGHVGEIIEDLGDEWMVRSSNYKLGSGTISSDRISKKDSSIVGYVPRSTIVANTKLPQSMKDALNIVEGYGNWSNVPSARRQEVLDNMQKIISNKTRHMQNPVSVKIIESAKNSTYPVAEDVSTVKSMTAGISAIEDIRNKMKQITTGPISNILNKSHLSWTPADKKAVQSMTEGAISGIARGFYDEVGVLTDQDIQNYKKIVPTIANTEQQVDAMINVLLAKAFQKTESTLYALSMLGKNVSESLPLYNQLQKYDPLKQQRDYNMAVPVSIGTQQQEEQGQPQQEKEPDLTKLSGDDFKKLLDYLLTQQ